jgi:hypothetical protein
MGLSPLPAALAEISWRGAGLNDGSMTNDLHNDKRYGHRTNSNLKNI